MHISQFYTFLFTIIVSAKILRLSWFISFRESHICSLTVETHIFFKRIEIELCVLLVIGVLYCMLINRTDDIWRRCDCFQVCTRVCHHFSSRVIQSESCTLIFLY